MVREAILYVFCFKSVTYLEIYQSVLFCYFGAMRLLDDFS